MPEIEHRRVCRWRAGGEGRSGSIVMTPIRERFARVAARHVDVDHAGLRSWHGEGGTGERGHPLAARVGTPESGRASSTPLASFSHQSVVHERHEFRVRRRAASVEVLPKIHVDRELERHVVVPQHHAVRIPVRELQHPRRIGVKRVIEAVVDAVRQEIRRETACARAGQTDRTSPR